jgi:hypothetical protein
LQQQLQDECQHDGKKDRACEVEYDKEAQREEAAQKESLRTGQGHLEVLERLGRLFVDTRRNEGHMGRLRAA